MEWNPEIPHFLSQCFLNKLSPPVLPSYASRGFRETHYMVLQFSVTLSGCWFRRRWPGRAISFRQFQKKKKKNHIKSRWSLVQHSETNPQNVNRYTWSWKLANQISYCDAGCWIKSKFRARPTKSLLKLGWYLAADLSEYCYSQCDEDEELFEMKYVEFIRRDMEGSDLDIRNPLWTPQGDVYELQGKGHREGSISDIELFNCVCSESSCQLET